MNHDEASIAGCGLDMAEAAEGIRHFYMEPSAHVGLRHVYESLWGQARSLPDLVALLDGAAMELDLSGDAGEAQFSRRAAANLRAFAPASLGLREFAVETLRAAGFDPSAQVRIARLFVAAKEAEIEFEPYRYLYERAMEGHRARMERHRKLERLRSAVREALLRPFRAFRAAA